MQKKIEAQLTEQWLFKDSWQLKPIVYAHDLTSQPIVYIHDFTSQPIVYAHDLTSQPIVMLMTLHHNL